MSTQSTTATPATCTKCGAPGFRIVDHRGDGSVHFERQQDGNAVSLMRRPWSGEPTIPTPLPDETPFAVSHGQQDGSVLDVARLAVALDNVDLEYERGWTPAHYARAIAAEYARLEPDA